MTIFDACHGCNAVHETKRTETSYSFNVLKSELQEAFGLACRKNALCLLKSRNSKQVSERRASSCNDPAIIIVTGAAAMKPTA